jgi:hypothetical protein
MAQMSELDNEVRIEVYRFFVAEGRPPVPAELALNLSIPSHEVESSLRRLADAHVVVLAPGTPYIWMANPLSALPSPYKVSAAGRDWWGICIWDSLGILAMLGGNGTVSSLCPDCGEDLQIRIVGGQLEPSDYIVHYAVPAAHWWDDIGFN